MNEPGVARRRAPSRVLVLVSAVPAAITLGWSLLMQPEFPTLLAPLLGPWAGLPLGQRECTMANGAPEVTAAVIAFIVAVAATWWFLRGPFARILVPVMAAVWALASRPLAPFSVVNTTA